MKLHLADEAVALWTKTEEELGEIGLPPPFWAFAWAGGQALARYIEDHPELVAGKRVLDFASGSGMVAIAAALSGASSVAASEIDDFALAAIEINAEANGVTVTTLAGDIVGRDDGWEVVFAGDVSYERDMAEAVTNWLEALAARGAEVLIGDPGRTYLAKDRLETNRRVQRARHARARGCGDQALRRLQVCEAAVNQATIVIASEAKPSIVLPLLSSLFTNRGSRRPKPGWLRCFAPRNDGFERTGR